MVLVFAAFGFGGFVHLGLFLHLLKKRQPGTNWANMAMEHAQCIYIYIYIVNQSYIYIYIYCIPQYIYIYILYTVLCIHIYIINQLINYIYIYLYIYTHMEHSPAMFDSP